MTTPFCYMVRCRTNGQVYYGVRYKTGCDPSDLWTKYFTSSKRVQQLIECYGPADFDFQVRKIFDSKEKARIWESKVLRRMKITQRSDFLNQHYTVASFVHKTGPFKGRKHTEESKCKTSNTMKERKVNVGRTREDLSERNKLNKGAIRPNMARDMVGSKNNRARPVITPLGTFGCKKDAAIAHQVHECTINEWLKKNKEGFIYV